MPLMPPLYCYPTDTILLSGDSRSWMKKTFFLCKICLRTHVIKIQDKKTPKKPSQNADANSISVHSLKKHFSSPNFSSFPYLFICLLHKKINFSSPNNFLLFFLGFFPHFRKQYFPSPNIFLLFLRRFSFPLKNIFFLSKGFPPFPSPFSSQPPNTITSREL